MNKIIFDILPLSIFFISYTYTNNIYTATEFLMASSVLQVVLVKIKNKKIDNNTIFSTLLIIILGTATVISENDFFIKLKPTVIYWFFGSFLLISRIIFNKNILRTMMQDKIILSNNIWNRLNTIWICFFIAMGLLNIFIAFSGLFNQSFWVNFKVFGTLIIFVLFLIGQIVFFKKEIRLNTKT
ncbi:inner membrane-spanning protein YciB [Candidatus Kinetoplastidibacterium desouzai]|uniref:inner membrane-spanning protein YciB n=1 Tax=Candidatus Kinetoplastidibacterium desouzai TaxID=994692 RepID=UPI0004BC1BA1|nr:inner membrane-spanning protein YciB [Candidatus Kinetoplastibacterium desouzaii]